MGRKGILLKRRIIWILAVCAAICFVAVGSLAFNPRVAQFFGYALPGNHGLPDRVWFKGRSYDQSSDPCETLDQITSSGLAKASIQIKQNDPSAVISNDQLAQVGALPTLFGAQHKILATPLQGYTTMVLFVEDGACYRTYVIEGGP